MVLLLVERELNYKEIYMYFYHVTINRLAYFFFFFCSFYFFYFLQIIFRATILTMNAIVAIDDISVTEECRVVNKSLSAVSAVRQQSEGKFCGFQYIFH